MEISKQKRKDSSRTGNGGRRAGAGRPREFVPTKAMRELVRMNLALRAYTHSDLCAVLINPATGEPISLQTFARCFAREIKTAKIELDAIALGGFVKQLRRGNMTAFIWHSKTQWGWSERKARVALPLPPIKTPADALAAIDIINAAVGRGEISSEEAANFSAMVSAARLAMAEIVDEENLQTLATAVAAIKGRDEVR